MESNILNENIDNFTSKDKSKLVFYDSFKYSKSQFGTEEIFFAKPIYINQIRIVKTNSIIHNNLKSEKRYLN